MTKKCSVANCDRNFYVVCDGCKLYFCQEHLSEHCLLTHLQLNSLVDNVNEIEILLQDFDPKTSLRLSYEKLEEWRKKAHQMIDSYFAEKIKLFNVYVDNKFDKYLMELKQLQTKILNCKREGEITHGQISLLTFDIQKLQKTVNKMNQNNIPVQTNPLVIDEYLINFDEYFDISSLPPVHRVIDRSDQSFTSVATNNHLLLLHYEQTLLLVDKELTTYKQLPWTYELIYDMCYSTALQRFVILTENQVYLLNGKNTKVNKVDSITSEQWFSCTCSDKSLYLSTKVYRSALVQFNLKPKIVLFKNWATLDICTDEEAIDGMNWNNNNLALMISNDTEKVVHLDLRSTTTMHIIWSLSLDAMYNPKRAFRFCSINSNEWIIADQRNSRLLQITKDGKLKKTAPYKLPPCCVTEVGKDMLAISTESVVHLHKF